MSDEKDGGRQECRWPSWLIRGQGVSPDGFCSLWKSGVKLSAESRGCASVCVCACLPRCVHSLPLTPEALNNLSLDTERADRWIDLGSKFSSVGLMEE